MRTFGGGNIRIFEYYVILCSNYKIALKYAENRINWFSRYEDMNSQRQ